MIVMVSCFTLSTPTGIAIGIGIGNTNATVEGVLESLAAGILLYMVCFCFFTCM